MGLVGRGRGGVSLVLGVLSLTLVGDLSLVAVVVVGRVCHHLSTTVGESHAVLSSDNFAVRVGAVVKIVSGVLVLDTVSELERHSLLVHGLLVCRGGGRVGR